MARTRMLSRHIINSQGPSIRQALEYSGSLPPIESVEFRSHDRGAKPRRFDNPDRVREFMYDEPPLVLGYGKVTVKFRGYERSHSASIERVWEKTMLVVQGRVAIVAAPDAVGAW